VQSGRAGRDPIARWRQFLTGNIAQVSLRQGSRGDGAEREALLDRQELFLDRKLDEIDSRGATISQMAGLAAGKPVVTSRSLARTITQLNELLGAGELKLSTERSNANEMSQWENE
jgi:aryl-alcohol dehydrogenase-like predicted oxidoreductase